ncbi:MAG: C25 family cysteine peptidase [Ignavibacteriaceae bacterium]
MRYSIGLFAILFAPFIIAQSIDLRDNNNQYDYVIISAPGLMSSCNNFKIHKKDKGLKVFVVSTDQVYSQFNSKISRKDNLREFISYAGTYWKSPRPKYFLLAGDLSEIPNYEYLSIQGYKDTTKTDYYYSVNLYDPDTLHTDFYVGRIAARTSTELTNYFNKVISYENSGNIEGWNQNSLIVSDDGKTPNGSDGNIFQDLSLQTGKQFPSIVNVKYYFESDTSMFYGNKDSILNYINAAGTGSVFFVGHGNDSVFTHEKLLTLNDINSINNGEKYFFVNFLGKNSFSTPSSTSLIDQMLFKKDGAVAGFNTVGLVFALDGSNLIGNYIKYLYSANHLTLGEAVSSVLNNSSYSQKKEYNIFGDPSLKLKYDITAGVNPPVSSIPEQYKLEHNYPNPFNPSTTIGFNLPKDDIVQLRIYDLLGNLITTLINGTVKAGRHEVKFNGEDLSSGIYFYSLKATNFKQTYKMVLIK